MVPSRAWYCSWQREASHWVLVEGKSEDRFKERMRYSGLKLGNVSFVLSQEKLVILFSIKAKKKLWNYLLDPEYNTCDVKWTAYKRKLKRACVEIQQSTTKWRHCLKEMDRKSLLNGSVESPSNLQGIGEQSESGRHMFLLKDSCLLHFPNLSQCWNVIHFPLAWIDNWLPVNFFVCIWVHQIIFHLVTGEIWEVASLNGHAKARSTIYYTSVRWVVKYLTVFTFQKEKIYYKTVLIIYNKPFWSTL